MKDDSDIKALYESALCELGKLSLAVEQSPVMVVITDTEGTIEYVNPRFTRVTGLAAKEVIGKNLAEVDGQPPGELKRLMEAVASGGEFQGEFKKKKGDVARWESATISPIKDARGAVTHFIKIAEDITERKRMEEEILRAGRLEALGLLAGGIAHDFNNILTSLLNNIALAKMSLRPEDNAFKKLRVAEKAIMRARNLTHQLSAFSKGSAPVKKTLSVGDLIRDSADFALRGSALKCEYSLPEGLWPVEADEGQISQVISNLVINAEQAMAGWLEARPEMEDHGPPEGGIVKVLARNAEPDIAPLRAGRYVRISIEDNGPGIPEEILPRIFDPYFTTKAEGTGLGLTTSWAIVNRHGGYISVESRPGRGASFHVYLPACVRETPKETGDSARPAFGKGKVLIMDDQHDIRESVGSALSFFGYEVEFAKDGSEALRLYKEACRSGGPYDAVILDLTVPGGMGGKEAVRRLRRLDARVRAIVSSGYEDSPVMSDYKKYGFHGAITKPYNAEELSLMLKNVISRGDCH